MPCFTRLQMQAMPHRRPCMSMAMGTSKYGGLLSQGFIRPGKFDAMLHKIADAGHASSQAMHVAKYAQMGAEAAAVAVKQAIGARMVMADTAGNPVAVPYHPKPGTAHYPYLAPPPSTEDEDKDK